MTHLDVLYRYGIPPTESATLAQTLDRMNTEYQLAADFIAQAETAWNRLFAAADLVQDRLKRLGETARGIGTNRGPRAGRR